MQVGNIFSEECSSIPWDEFQVSFIYVWYDVSIKLNCAKILKLLIDLADIDNLLGKI